MPPLAPELFPELSAAFYTSDPAEFARLQNRGPLARLALPTEQIAPLLARPAGLARLEMTPTGPPTDEVRERYIATESVMLFHHAAGMILRLFYARRGSRIALAHGMSASDQLPPRSRKGRQSRESGFSESDIAVVFLGGTRPS